MPVEKKPASVSLPAISEAVAARLLVAFQSGAPGPDDGPVSRRLGIAHEDGSSRTRSWPRPRRSASPQPSGRSPRRIQPRTSPVSLDAALAGPRDVGQPCRPARGPRGVSSSAVLGRFHLHVPPLRVFERFPDGMDDERRRLDSPAHPHVLEIVLGIDTSSSSRSGGKLRRPARARAKGGPLARHAIRIGCAHITWVMRLTTPLFGVLGQEISPDGT